jgi:uncharacterized coiled-coil DUF342 family protein
MQTIDPQMLDTVEITVSELLGELVKLEEQISNQSNELMEKKDQLGLFEGLMKRFNEWQNKIELIQKEVTEVEEVLEKTQSELRNQNQELANLRTTLESILSQPIR